MGGVGPAAREYQTEYQNGKRIVAAPQNVGANLLSIVTTWRSLRRPGINSEGYHSRKLATVSATATPNAPHRKPTTNEMMKIEPDTSPHRNIISVRPCCLLYTSDAADE